MYWYNKRSPAVTSSRINFYYTPSMDEIASMLVSSPDSFNFEYVEQISSDQQHGLLTHFEDVYDEYPTARSAIESILKNIPIGASAANIFIIDGERYEKFPSVKVNRVTSPHFLTRMADHYKKYPDKIDIILQNILLSKGQGTKISEAIKLRPELAAMFEFNIPQAIDRVGGDTDVVSLARNISKTNATVPTKYYDTLESYILMSVLSDDLKVKTQTANKHMKNIKRAAVSNV